MRNGQTSGPVIGRRMVLAGPVALSLATAGCGWHAVYGGGTEGPVARELSRISVALMPERSGQLLRLALQERFERFGRAEARVYDLSSSFGVSAEGIAIRTDNTTTRIRLVGVANWTLSALAPQHPTLTSGLTRVVDGLDVVNQQLFAADMQNETDQRRMAEAAADQITLQLARYFRARDLAASPA